MITICTYIHEAITFHPAWLGKVSGLIAEKMIRDQKIPYLYVLRAGEFPSDYYVSFVQPDFTVKHQPFVLTETSNGWCFENWHRGGPFTDESIEDVIHLIMHCRKDQCIPFHISA
jgi:hypothetical protein